MMDLLSNWSRRERVWWWIYWVTDQGEKGCDGGFYYVTDQEEQGCDGRFSEQLIKKRKGVMVDLLSKWWRRGRRWWWICWATNESSNASVSQHLLLSFPCGVEFFLPPSVEPSLDQLQMYPFAGCSPVLNIRRIVHRWMRHFRNDWVENYEA